VREEEAVTTSFVVKGRERLELEMMMSKT